MFFINEMIEKAAYLNNYQAENNYTKYVTYIVLNSTKEQIEEYINNNPRKKNNIEILLSLLNDNKQLKNKMIIVEKDIDFFKKIAYNNIDRRTNVHFCPRCLSI